MRQLNPNEQFMGNVNLKKAGVTIPYSENDVREIIRCKEDIIYFVEKYVQIISIDDGRVPFVLYPFQKKMIEAYHDHQQVICLTCRQAGKCVTGNTKVEVTTPQGQRLVIQIGELFDDLLRDQESEDGPGSAVKSSESVPMLPKELRRNSLDSGWCGEETNLARTLGADSLEKKFTHSLNLSGWKIRGPYGNVPLAKLHKTIEYEVWSVVFEDGRQVRCADNHIFISLFGAEVCCKDLYPGFMLKSADGITKVLSVTNTHMKEVMFDPEIAPGFIPHYFANGIHSHNTTTAAAFLLWEMIFNTDITAAILANKASTAQEILDRLKMMYEFLPLFLQPGIVVWNKTRIELANNCKAISAATSSSSIRGLSVSCVAGDTMVCVEDEGDVFYTTIDKINMRKLVNNNGEKVKKYYTVYKITNLINSKEYVGFHGTNDLDDGYMGSGKLIKKAIEKYGIENFSKEYIGIFDNKEEAEEMERVIVRWRCWQ